MELDGVGSQARRRPASTASRLEPPPAESVANPVNGTPVSDAAAKVARVLLSVGPASTQELAKALGATSVGVGRHLDHLETAGWVSHSEHAPYGPGAVVRPLRGRGRPARVWSLTPAGRRGVAGPERVAEQFAAAALEYLRGAAGPRSVDEFANAYATAAGAAWVEAGARDPHSLAEVLTAQGYAAVVTSVPDGGAVQLCQHHCPIESAARANPEVCEAETKAIARILGRNVVRLSTISTGGHICTTLVPPTTTTTTTTTKTTTTTTTAPGASNPASAGATPPAAVVQVPALSDVRTNQPDEGTQS